jgi:hypothetical protein
MIGEEKEEERKVTEVVEKIRDGQYLEDQGRSG